MAPTVIFIRHAESLGNAAVKERGESALSDKSLADCGISPTGHEQAAALRPEFEGRRFAAIYCSPARRCRETLLGIYPDTAGLPVRVDSRLAEGRGWAEFNELGPLNPTDWPPAWDLTEAADCRIENEPFHVVSIRMQLWWKGVLDTVTGGDILVVTHKWPILLWAQDWPEETVDPKNCQPITFWDAAY